MSRLTSLHASGLLEPLDVELGKLLRRRAEALAEQEGKLLAPDDAEILSVAAAMTSHERALGHSGVDLGRRGSAPTASDRTEASTGALLLAHDESSDASLVAFPDPKELRDALSRSPICGDGTTPTPTPLVLENDRLYLYRYFAAEKRLAENIRKRLGVVPTEPPSRATIDHFRRIFPPGSESEVDWQAVAAAAALRGRFTIITGGPGTGKTTTIGRVLAVMLQAEPHLRVALAAPTGKAAARLSEAIRATVSTLPIDDDLRGRIPLAGYTLHRLLGYQPWKESFAHNTQNPLGYDVVIVDEASMVDLLLMDALFAALRSDARVILLGDEHQLASVEAGYVLGDVCRATTDGGDTHGEEFAAWVKSLSGATIPARTGVEPLRDSVVRLTRSYRFEAHPGIGRVADAIREKDVSTVLATLDDPSWPDVQLRETAGEADIITPILPVLERYLESSTPDEALARLGTFRVLCALREGRRGVTGLNRAVERWLESKGRSTREQWYHLRPVLVTANDPATGLFNGDLGVCFREAGVARIHFAVAEGTVRSLSPARLPSHETAWAMTVHKAQGSEFDHVLVVLPEKDARVLGRELLYTAVTRAKERVDIVGPREIVATTVTKSTERMTAVGERIVGAHFWTASG